MSMIVRNPTATEVEAAADVATAAFPNLSAEHWQKSFAEVAQGFGRKFILIVELDGKIVSSLVCCPAPIFVGKGTITHSSVGAVGTLPECRQKGCAGAMMAESVRLLRNEGIYASSLWPFSYEYYRKFGWEVGSEVRSYAVDVKTLAAAGDASRARAASEDDYCRIKAAYLAYTRNYNCLTQRSDEWWEKVARVSATDLKLAADSGRGVIVHGAGEIANGYAVYDVIVHEDSRKSFEIKEIVFAEPEHRRDILAFFQTIDPEARVSFVSPVDDKFLQELPNPRAAHCDITPSFQFRITDPRQAMLSLVNEEYVSGKLSFRISDPVFEEGFEFGIDIGNGQASLCAYDKKKALKMSVQTFARLFSGYLTPLDAWNLGRLEIAGDVMPILAIASQAFSPLVPYRTWLEPG